MNLTTQAIKDLRIAIQNTYGLDFQNSLSDEDMNEIGYLFLNILTESLKIKTNINK